MAVADRPSPSCAGCGYSAPPAGGPTHPYIGASPECWAVYGELLAKGLDQPGVDTYAVQHPGVDERRSRQSVAVHLVSLCAALEYPETSPQGVDLLRRAVARTGGYPWLDLPTPVGTITAADVACGRADGRDWARDVWQAWRPHHATVRRWWSDLADL